MRNEPGRQEANVGLEANRAKPMRLTSNESADQRNRIPASADAIKTRSAERSGMKSAEKTTRKASAEKEERKKPTGNSMEMNKLPPFQWKSVNQPSMDKTKPFDDPYETGTKGIGSYFAIPSKKK
ncbi:unnamed protein product [Nippostrongylus brasiliensis]|uniref:Uncharacterized protein n=1 Tax=Nippostrongylus brasiliensis TaxID=27835 RepID=A0A0N4Y368_NIPBR|nr:unnamed protein product [Nippostrongylus brasiliensis]